MIVAATPSATTVGAPEQSGRRLKVCLASWAPFVGGAEMAAERLAVGLRDAGHDVFVLLGRDGPVLERMRAVALRCRVTPMRFTGKASWPLYWLARRRLIRILRDERPDVIHCNDLPTLAMVADAARRVGVPRICHHRFPFSGAATAWMAKFGAEHHIYITSGFRTEMFENTPWLAGESWSEVYDGVPLPPLPTDEDRSRARQELSLPEQAAVVLFAGQVVECKGVADLIRAWQYLGDEYQARADLVIVGDDRQAAGAYRAKMEDLARQLGVRARFAGFQTDVGKWQTAATIAVVPSRVEPLGLVNLEAMARAVPVVASRVGGIPEIVVDGQTGVLVPPESPADLAAAIRRLLDDPDARVRLGRFGRRRCEERFTLEAHTRAVVAVYRRVLSGARARAVG